MVVSKKSRIRRDRIASRDGGITMMRRQERMREWSAESREQELPYYIRKTAGPSLVVFRVFGKTWRHQRHKDVTSLKSKVHVSQRWPSSSGDSRRLSKIWPHLSQDGLRRLFHRLCGVTQLLIPSKILVKCGRRHLYSSCISYHLYTNTKRGI